MRRALNSVGFSLLLWAAVIVLALNVPINVMGEPETGLGFWGWFWVGLTFLSSLDVSIRFAILYSEWRKSVNDQASERRNRDFEARYPALAASERGDYVDYADVQMDLYRMLNRSKR